MARVAVAAQSGVEFEAARQFVEAIAQRISDDDVRKTMIQESIASYRGNCPCPYSRAANGSSCGKRSAYSRPGGASLLCYPDDISQQMIEQYRRRRGLAR